MRKRFAVPFAAGCVLGAMVLGRSSGMIQMANANPQERPHHGAKDVPIVVELFTSEGCSSCPPADDVLARLERSQPVGGAIVVPLAFHVDYWDELGWPDPFASPAFTVRQRMYGAMGGRMYTPQAVIDGKTELVGSEAAALERAVRSAALRPHVAVEAMVLPKGDSLEVAVHVEPMPAAIATGRNTVFVALTQVRAETAVLRGENGGRTLRHTAIVRDLQAAGTVEARGGEARAVVHAPPGVPRSELRVVAFVQRTDDHEIIGSMSRPLTP